MTHDQDMERALDRWFSAGPTRMPDHLFEAVVERIEHVPQRRLAGLRARLSSIRPDRRFAAAAVIVVLVAGLGAAFLSQAPATDVGPSPTPSSAVPASPPLASPPSGVLPGTLQATWASVGTRVLPYHYSSYVAGTNVVIGPTTIEIWSIEGDLFNSASFVGPDTIELRSLTGPSTMSWKCQLGDVGIYSVGLSADGATLTLTSLGDACEGRALALAGEWTHTDLGDLAAGRHVARLFKPFTGGTTGTLGFTVPTGWVERGESDGSLFLVGPNPTILPIVLLYSTVIPETGDPECPIRFAPVEARTAAEITTWLGTVPGLVVTKPTPVTFGGLTGTMVDVSVAPSWTGDCPRQIASTGPAPVRTFASSGGVLSIAGETRARYILLDRGDGQALLIDIEAQDEATRDAVLGAAMPIVESFEFDR